MNDPRPTIYLAILNQGEIRIELVYLLVRWMQDDRYKIYLDLPCDKPIAHNRAKIVERFLKSGYDYLMMLDGDIIPPADTISLADYDKDVIGGACFAYKNSSIVPLVLEYNKGEGDEYRVKSGDKMFGVQEVDAIGTGCIMIARRVLEDVKAPFINIYNEDGIRERGLDLSFCKKAKKLGYKVWVNFDYLCSHWTMVDLKAIYGGDAEYGNIKVKNMGKMN